MRCLIALLALFLLSVAPARADGGLSVSVEDTRQSRLDRLFADLRREHNEIAADRIAQSIWREWSTSGSATADLLMMHATRAMKNKKPDVALDLLDQVTVLEPGFAEGWNKRATLHFMMKDYAKSMADIARTLSLEPRHFGALSGMANILRARGDDELALKAFQQALAVYPMMREAQKAVAEIADEIAGEGI